MHTGLKQLFELFSFIDKINKKEKSECEKPDEIIRSYYSLKKNH